MTVPYTGILTVQTMLYYSKMIYSDSRNGKQHGKGYLISRNAQLSNHQANNERYQIPVYYVISSLSFHHYSSARNTNSSGRYLDITDPPTAAYTHLEDIQSDKYIGVVLDNRLSFNKHTDEIAIKKSN